MPIRYTVKVKPGCRRNEVEVQEDYITVKTTKQPHGGEANKAVIALLAQHFGVPKSAVRIILGSTSREKLVEISS